MALSEGTPRDVGIGDGFGEPEREDAGVSTTMKKRFPPIEDNDNFEEIVRIHHPECDWPGCEEDTPEDSFCDLHSSMGLKLELRTED